MVWCDVVWCDVVWCDVVWCDVVWCDVVWCDVVWCDVVWCLMQTKCNFRYKLFVRIKFRKMFKLRFRTKERIITVCYHVLPDNQCVLFGASAVIYIPILIFT